MIGYRMKGDFSKSLRYLEKIMIAARLGNLDRYGREGVAALASATPSDTGTTAGSWYYKIERDTNVIKLIFCNSNVQNGVPIAIILDVGHATRGGGWVEGRGYIDPAIQPLFDKLAKDAWEEVTKL